MSQGPGGFPAPPTGFPSPQFPPAPSYGPTGPQAVWGGQPYGPPSSQSPSSFKVLAIILGVALVCALIGNVVLATSKPSSLPTETVTITVFPTSTTPKPENPAAVLTSLYEITVGACFGRQFLLASNFRHAMVVPCQDLHDAEVIFVGDMPHSSGPVPGDPQWEDWATEFCDPAFEDYIGLPENKSKYTMRWIVPGSHQWNSGISTLFCYVYAGREQAGSFQGSNS